MYLTTHCCTTATFTNHVAILVIIYNIHLHFQDLLVHKVTLDQPDLEDPLELQAVVVQLVLLEQLVLLVLLDQLVLQVLQVAKVRQVPLVQQAPVDQLVQQVLLDPRVTLEQLDLQV